MKSTPKNPQTSHIILGIETSCDETGLALYDTRKGLLAEALSSQIDIHAKYGGVVPEIASRDHANKITSLFDSMFMAPNISFKDISMIAYTRGPGLAGSLMVGAAFAQGLSWANETPLMGIHHLEAHLLSPMINNTSLSFPYLGVLISGGHTQLFSVISLGKYDLLGETQDDAIGEAFDKTAKLLGLGYPGGPAISTLSKEFTASVHQEIQLPRPMIHSSNLNMSFSGIKTAVRLVVQKLPQPITKDHKISIAYSFEKACVETIIEKIRKACDQTGLKKFAVTGGVSANLTLRNKAKDMAEKNDLQYFFPENRLCTDNGIMIAHAAAQYMKIGTEWNRCSIAKQPLVLPRWPLATTNP
ncbi:MULTISPECIES: tRNA (adenosine(37)-N6)-threonylcarbamoyltransferase complex transferase subunit TsaD [Candidatus Ichthyocystis]|uniref:tRNA N6-adenosine threonylcarbamoyltransferase n=1 Tax=Candidatus Ichthyocystis hellenicum TaxID=1561003 RepID=A0A0S4M419_9BURK|nr:MULTISPECIES: tRNA (adenosine(37)-N6)-threonylcarbamoyltransferase complex transferase subunit TsaD [Ichthyocystis]CUT17021.1 putative N6-L-threonylcarbamoyladenine synthase [Candidatus Ichthyocystis hellenicum]